MKTAKQSVVNSSNKTPAPTTTTPPSIYLQTLEQTASCLGVCQDLLLHHLQSHEGASLHAQLLLLHVAAKHGLDPMAGEIQLVRHHEQAWSPLITVDGWMKIINQHPHYQGMSLRDSSDETHGVPNWMECCIYRDDRILPVVVREYWVEVKTDHTLWITMPRRMLRHRVIQQCARLAFGISSPESLSASQNHVNDPPSSGHLQTNPIEGVEELYGDLKHQAIQDPPHSRTEWLKAELIKAPLK